VATITIATVLPHYYNSAAPDEHQLAYCSSLQHVLDLSPAHKAFAQNKDAPINVAQLIDDKISDINLQHHGASHNIDGRLGPLQVSVDPNSCSGSFSYGTHDLYLESLTNFSSCRAGVCVFKGKWMYECTLHTAGIQQVGWATIHCPFTAEEGVGDAPDSYAYDGGCLAGSGSQAARPQLLIMHHQAAVGLYCICTHPAHRLHRNKSPPEAGSSLCRNAGCSSSSSSGSCCTQVPHLLHTLPGLHPCLTPTAAVTSAVLAASYMP
jgi:hypothetical protein